MSLVQAKQSILNSASLASGDERFAAQNRGKNLKLSNRRCSPDGMARTRSIRLSWSPLAIGSERAAILWRLEVKERKGKFGVSDLVAEVFNLRAPLSPPRNGFKAENLALAVADRAQKLAPSIRAPAPAVFFSA